MQINAKIKEYAPYIIGGVAGIYIIYRVVNGNSSSSSLPSGQAVNYVPVSNGTSGTQAAQMQLAQGQVNAEQTAAYGQAAAQIGQAVAQVSNQRMAFDASTINAASADNQATMQAMALESVGGMNAATSAIGAAGQASAAVGNATANQINAMGKMFQGSANAIIAGANNSHMLVTDNSLATINAINSLGQLHAIDNVAMTNSITTQSKNTQYGADAAASSSGATSGAVGTIAQSNAAAAAAASQANAEATAATWNAVGSVASTVAMAAL